MTAPSLGGQGGHVLHQPQQPAAPEPAPAQPAPAPVQPEPHFTCAFCGTRQPLSQLVQTGTGALECADLDDCMARAASSDLYPKREGELDIARRETTAGALR